MLIKLIQRLYLYYNFKRIILQTTNIIKEMNYQQHHDIQTDIQNFIERIKQEQLCPQILLFQQKLFESIKRQIDDYKMRQQHFLKNNQENIDEIFQKNFRYLIYNAQKQKIDYLLKLYLRIRIQKIQKFAFYLVKNSSQAERLLSLQQKLFLNDYAKLRYKHFSEIVLSMFNKNYRGFIGLEIKYQNKKQERVYVQSRQSKIDLIEPNLESFCFTKILRNPGQLRYNHNITAVNMTQNGFQSVVGGDIIFGPYKQVKQIIERRQAELI